MNQPKMMLIKMQQGANESFRLISISSESEFIEAVFVFTDKILQLICKQRFNTYQLVKKLDANGDLEINKKTGEPKQERRQIETQYDLAITDKENILKFVSLMTEEKHDLEKYFIVPEQQKNQPLQMVKDEN